MSVNTTALVTGGAGGIGSAICRTLAEAGYRVIVHYHTSESAAIELAAEIGGVAVPADVSDYAQVKAMFERIGGVDVLINNAGTAHYGLFQLTTPEERRRIVDVNLHGAMNCAELALPYMLRRHSGSIINISSIWGVEGASCEVAYSASKAALIGFTKALAKELSPSGITVNCIAPGVVDTKMNARFTREELAEVGEIIAPSAVARELMRFVTGELRNVTGKIAVLSH
ncbi:MAG: SDR family NAD(P)-dependent oxidoreductase [Oscillospiraceae bacterium]|jgi:3-oxoacyl-[acyl-carrier protein] reductase|nr:SDR family NAD(P)-dependent oxidoreductase [Oscillospiraceae bacterium]